jgi:ABC-2 type transport system ATP-binding protein
MVVRRALYNRKSRAAKAYLSTQLSSREDSMSEVVLDAKGLTKTYGDMNAVDNLDLQVFKGEVYSMLGPNGAGKTTTVEILEGLRNPTSGTATVFGFDVQKDYDKVRSKVGVLPQTFEPWDRIRPPEAIAYWAGLFGRKMTAKEIHGLLEMVDLAHKDKVWGERLSGGEKRRLGIAMALVGDPELVFLDEPTTGLDPQARRGLWEIIHALGDAGKTVVSGSPEELVNLYGGGTRVVLRGAGDVGVAALEKLGYKGTVHNRDVTAQVPALMRTKDFITQINQSGIAYKDFETKRPSLEDVFFNMVGGRMEEGVLKQ